MDKVSRIGIRVQDLFDPEGLRDKIAGALHHRNQVLVKIFNRRAIDVDLVCEQLLSYAPLFEAHVADTGLLLNRALDDGRYILLEGSQGRCSTSITDLPFVTSSNPTSGGACAGSGDRTHADLAGARDPQGVHDPGGRRAVPDGTVRRRR